MERKQGLRSLGSINFLHQGSRLGGLCEIWGIFDDIHSLDISKLLADPGNTVFASRSIVPLNDPFGNGYSFTRTITAFARSA